MLVASIAVIARLVFHAFFMPAYEGPDEAPHLGRVCDFADRPWIEALRGGPLDAAVVADVRAHPCSPEVSHVAGCTPFGDKPASFNLLRPVKTSAPVLPPQRNPENNQPPGFYLVAGLFIRAVGIFVDLKEPAARLLAVRLFCCALTVVGISFFARTTAFRTSRLFALSCLVLLALPGAAESLVRCSNDAAVFAWCCVAFWMLDRPTNSSAMVLLLAVGPLWKLTALPIAAVVVFALWRRGQRSAAFAGIAAVSLVFPLQALRGWHWGGTYELNRPAWPLNEDLSAILLGFGRSVYAFVKTTFWLGGRSFFRAPKSLVAAYAALGVGFVSMVRPRRDFGSWAPHAAGAVVAAAGFVIFALANRRFFGGWGGVGGWYA